jgi:hypothetical protein
LCFNAAVRSIKVALLLFVQLSSERARQAVRQDCSFAKKQASPPALLVVVLSGSVRHGDWAVAGERFGGGAGVCEAARPRRRTFQFLEVAQCGARGVTGVGIRCNV